MTCVAEYTETHANAQLSPRQHHFGRQNLDQAPIGNCSTAALIDTRAKITFCCLPNFDSDPMFCDLLNGGQEPSSASDSESAAHGFWDIDMEQFASSVSQYVRNTAILETTLTDKQGQSVKIVDFCPRFKLFDRTFRPTMIVRKMVPVSGQPRVTIRCRPARDYGAATCEVSRGSNHLKYKGSDMTIRLTTDVPISFVEKEIAFVVDRPLHLIFGPNESMQERPEALANEFYDKTKAYWELFTKQLHVPYEYQADVIRSAITLKLCSFQESGAILAALTTSLPESGDGSGRCWDYRFCWLRDSYHTVHALNRLGATSTMQGYLRFIVNIVTAARSQGDGDLQPLYGLCMQTDLEEHKVPSLSGYRGIGPVRRGNGAWTQVQNDNYGSVILALQQMFFDERICDDGKQLADLYCHLEHLGQIALQKYDKPDAGLWELRGSKHVHTFSVAMCWAACDRLALIAQKLHLCERRAFWSKHADHIKQYILDGAWDEEKQSFIAVLNPTDDYKPLDASLLLLAPLKFCEATDPRFVATVDAIGKTLMKDGLLFRYVVEDDFGEPDNSFVVCTFWYIEALAMMGRRKEAKAMFERILSFRNHVGLFSEDLSFETKELWGNFPQTYSMVGIINTAMHLSDSWDSVGL